MPLQILKIGQIVSCRYFRMGCQELTTEIIGSAAEEQRAKRAAAAPASVLAQGVLRPVWARRKQGVKFLFVYGVASRDKVLQIFSLREF